MPKQNGSILPIILVLIGLLILSGGFWFFNSSKNAPKDFLKSNETTQPSEEKKYQNKDFPYYTITYPENKFVISTTKDFPSTSVNYCPGLKNCNPQENILIIREYPNLDQIDLETWINTSPDSVVVADGKPYCWNNDPRTTQDAGDFQGFPSRSYLFKLDSISKMGVCKDKQFASSGNMEYKYIQYGDKIIFIEIADASDEAFPLLKKVAESITLTSIPKSNATETWNPVCKRLNLDTLSIPVAAGDGQTDIARRVIDEYFNHVTLSNLNSQVPRLSAAESIYAEDYIRKNVVFGELVVNKQIPIPCTVVEEATLKARLLTISQKENISKFSDQVPERQIDDLINQQLEKLYQQAPDLRQNSGVLKVQ